MCVRACVCVCVCVRACVRACVRVCVRSLSWLKLVMRRITTFKCSLGVHAGVSVL